MRLLGSEDDEHAAIEGADLVIVDGQLRGAAADVDEDALQASVLAAVRPVRGAVAEGYWRGSAVAGFGVGAVALGRGGAGADASADAGDGAGADGAADALVPFVVRVAGESEGWAALKRASALMQSEVPDGSGVGLGAGASAVVDVGCRVRSPLPGGPEGAIALVSGRAIRRRAAEVEEGRRRAAAEEAERQRAAREAEERAYRLSHARELDRQRVEEGPSGVPLGPSQGSACPCRLWSIVPASHEPPRAPECSL